MGFYKRLGNGALSSDSSIGALLLGILALLLPYLAEESLSGSVEATSTPRRHNVASRVDDRVDAGVAAGSQVTAGALHVEMLLGAVSSGQGDTTHKYAFRQATHHTATGISQNIARVHVIEAGIDGAAASFQNKVVGEGGSISLQVKPEQPVQSLEGHSKVAEVARLGDGALPAASSRPPSAYTHGLVRQRLVVPHVAVEDSSENIDQEQHGTRSRRSGTPESA